MIRGLGIDLVEVVRIGAAMANPRFLERILTARERETAGDVRWVAGRWAAKEAVAKAVGTHLGWHDVEILNDAEGRPEAIVAGTPGRVWVSITHEQHHAAAVAVWEDDPSSPRSQD